MMMRLYFAELSDQKKLLNMDSWDNMPCENVLLAMDITLD
jgi:hypothetical protein